MTRVEKPRNSAHRQGNGGKVGTWRPVQIFTANKRKVVTSTEFVYDVNYTYYGCDFQ